MLREHEEYNDINANNKYLVGYYTSNQVYELNKNAILNYLKERLPVYMLPNVLIQLEKWPLTTNAKLDKNALPLYYYKDNYVAPRNTLEQQICEIWSEVLGITKEKIGIHDDFFGLGGNSILIIKLMNKINRFYNLNLESMEFFKNTTIEQLVHYLDRLKTTVNQRAEYEF